MDINESDLITKTQQGDKGAFGELYELHVEWVSKFIISRVPNREDAHDLIQDTFVRAFKGIGHFNEDSSFGAWLSGIVKNVVADYFRSQNRWHDKLHLLYDPSQSFSTRDIDRRIDARTLAHEVFNRLNSNHRQVLEFRVMQGKSVEETAQLMYGEDNDQNRHKVSSQLYKAVKAAYQVAITIRNVAPNE